MARPAPLYDLVLLLDSEASEDQRAKVLSDVERIITGSGEIVSDQDWGLRALAYEIRHKPDAQYHLLQFHAPRPGDGPREHRRRCHEGPAAPPPRTA